MAEPGGNRKADLHTHTNYSDGMLSPEALLNKAKSVGLTYLAITDHDNVDAIEEAIVIGESLGIEIVPGVEISSEHNGREVHILGYFFDHKDETFLECLKNFRHERFKRAELIVEKLTGINLPLTMDEVLVYVKGNGSIGRPHIALAMLEKGYVDTYIETFNKYLGDGKSAYVKKPHLSSKDAIDLIAKSGGLSFIAHPAKNVKEEELIQIIEFGIDGIEIIHPSHSQNDVAFFQATAGQYFLLESGGSDFHGGKINNESVLGNFWVSEQKVNAMKNRLFKN